MLVSSDAILLEFSLEYNHMTVRCIWRSKILIMQTRACNLRAASSPSGHSGILELLNHGNRCLISNFPCAFILLNYIDPVNNTQGKNIIKLNTLIKLENIKHIWLWSSMIYILFSEVSLRLINHTINPIIPDKYLLFLKQMICDCYAPAWDN